MTSLINSIAQRFSVWALAALLAFSISTVSTGYGAFVSLVETTGAPKAAVAFAAAAASSFISLLGFVVWRKFGVMLRLRGYAVAAGLLVAGATLTLTSIAFSSGGIVYWTQNDGLRARLATEAAKNVVLPLSEFSDRVGRIHSLTDAVSQLANRKASIEASQGGTCGGLPVAGAGPLTRLRAQQSADAAQVSTAARGLQEETLLLMAKLSSNPSQAALTDAYRQARLLNNDRRMIEVRSWAQEMNRNLTNGQFFWEGAIRSCPDSELQTIVSALVGEIDRQIDLPTTVPVIVEPDLFYSMRVAVDGAISGLRGTTGTHRSDSFAVLPIILLAALIDVVGLLSAAAIGRRPEVITGGDLSYRHRLRWHLNALRWDSGDKCYLVVPLNGEDGISIEANNIAVRYNLRRIPGMTGISAEEISEINPYEAQRLQAVSGGASRFTGYAFNDALIAEWKNLERLLRFDRAGYSYSGPPKSSPTPPSLTTIDGGKAGVV